MATMRIQFSNGRGLEDLGVATEYDLYENIDVNVCIDFEMLKVIAPIFQNIVPGKVDCVKYMTGSARHGGSLMDVPLVCHSQVHAGPFSS